MKSNKEITFIDLGIVPYHKTLTYQRLCVDEVKKGMGDRVIFCEHLPIITMGRKSHQENFLCSPEELKRKGIEVASIDRGGDLTLHAPGQLVMYPIIDLKRRGWGLREYLHFLEDVAVRALQDFDIEAHGDDEVRGVWVENQKIASIGIGVSRWVTYHGIALNVNTDLSLFNVIRPCGLDVKMTSLQVILEREIMVSEMVGSVKEACVGAFREASILRCV